MAHDDLRDPRTMVETCATVAMAPAARTSIVSAVVDDISPDGVARVVVTGESRPRPALTTMRFATAADASDTLLGRTVLVLLGASEDPVILGAVEERLWERRGDEPATEVRASLAADQPVQVKADRRVVAIEAADEIRLTCGKSALVMRRDGTVVVRGVKIVSRASGTHRILGATVGIN